MMPYKVDTLRLVRNTIDFWSVKYLYGFLSEAQHDLCPEWGHVIGDPSAFMVTSL